MNSLVSVYLVLVMQGRQPSFLFCKGPRSRCYGRTAALRLIVQPCDEDDQFFSFFQVMEHRWNEIDRGKPKYSGGQTCPNATLSTTNPTWTDPGSNPGLRGKRPATNRLSHGTALLLTFLQSRVLEGSFYTRCDQSS
jgi:hypothetical protein